jgi:DeoR family transcriptional regulator of aga operon
LKSAERQSIILDLLRTNKQISVQQIKEQMPDVADITIRRDLEAMDREKQLVRVRGGAKSLESILSVWEDSYPNRMRDHMAQKKEIGRKAASLISSHTSIFLDSGSTAMSLADCMPDMEIEVFTTGLTCALELARLKNVNIQMLGGKVNKNSYSVNGDASVIRAQALHFQISFMGVTGYIPGRGFITRVADDFALKQTIVHNSQKTVVIFDSSKVGQDGTYTFASMDEIDVAVTDADLPREAKEDLLRYGIEIL